MQENKTLSGNTEKIQELMNKANNVLSKKLGIVYKKLSTFLEDFV